ncbi:hypothetical protein BDV33DRAFT_210396 [Aspergillus novoparasiticus]|uniref:Uncharacterized protein n=1 Tax=Aspergillus novoparasiticus TaxID=986946 RepID=A0A5N6E8W7_9EURO|nr:hypothetical protein BDV33DRAFT_210396 [Aspergillus novoparasiticus]
MEAIRDSRMSIHHVNSSQPRYTPAPILHAGVGIGYVTSPCQSSRVDGRTDHRNVAYLIYHAENGMDASYSRAVAPLAQKGTHIPGSDTLPCLALDCTADVTYCRGTEPMTIATGLPQVCEKYLNKRNPNNDRRPEPAGPLHEKSSTQTVWQYWD